MVDAAEIRHKASVDHLRNAYMRLASAAAGEITLKPVELKAIELFITLADPHAAAILKPQRGAVPVLPADANAKDVSSMSTAELFERAKELEGPKEPKD